MFITAYSFKRPTLQKDKWILHHDYALQYKILDKMTFGQNKNTSVGTCTVLA
jgi:hypothetical protein